MMKGIQARKSDDEAGFTLIELLVVVLILGILMAIAIPTFLSLTGGAKSSAAEADLTTATQDEAVYEAQYSDFDGTNNTPSAADNISATVTPAGLLATDPGLNWTTSALTSATAGKKIIYVDMITVTSLILGSAGQNGNFYWVYDNNGAVSYGYNTTATAPAAPATSWAASWKAATIV